ncbi:hypothetical protein BPO_1468 [Bergeyella porcorum]|uniref:Uncharacterized protein n=1 Tax=Bergeyella porcorum TaxID=1735111 RepID=A0AAU0F1B1_9FLAO
MGNLQIGCGVIPTNRPIQRHDRHDLVYKPTERIQRRDRRNRKAYRGRKTSIGGYYIGRDFAVTIPEHYSLEKFPHQVLNAKLHKKEQRL